MPRRKPDTEAVQIPRETYAMFACRVEPIVKDAMEVRAGRGLWLHAAGTPFPKHTPTEFDTAAWAYAQGVMDTARLLAKAGVPIDFDALTST